MSQYCLSCGACCASFRVSFYWAETDAHPQGHVPNQLTQAINQHFVCMNGTHQNPVRCVALQGDVGSKVVCSIYEKRSSTCREFMAGSEECNKARLNHGLSAIEAS